MFNIILSIVLFVLGLVIGMVAAIFWSTNEVVRMNKVHDEYVKSAKKIMETDSRIIYEFSTLIKHYTTLIQQAYTTLVDVRDKGLDDVDIEETIGNLGQALDE